MFSHWPGLTKHVLHFGIALFGALIVTACGGGGGSDSGSIAPVTVNPALSIADASVTEGDTGTATLTFTVTASATVPVGGSIADASVSYATSAGSATAGSDFTATSGTLQIPAGTTQVNISVEVVGDADSEGNESFSLTLSAPSNATISRGTATGTIIDDDVVAGVFGLDQRPDNVTCTAPARPSGDASVAIADPFPASPGFSQPTKLLPEPGGDRWFVLQKSGQVMTFSASNPAAVSEYLDLTDTRAIRTRSEGGLLGMAFHPDYPTTPQIFLSYTIDHTGPSMRSVISRFTLDNLSNPGAGTSEQVILEVDQDFDNHNGGDIAFGPDGYLYIALGDGGSGNDPRARAQDNTRLLGAMLRVDVTGTGAGYTIPGDNPFAGNTPCGPGANGDNCPEIFAWGLRNPWRWTFDPDNGDLWLADVGQNATEEVNLIERGGNYGWRCKEGSNDTSNAGDCSGLNLIDPVTEYSHSVGNSITGGQVYRGTAIPELVGRYIFADYGSGRFWAAQPDGQGNFDNDELINSSFGPTAMATGPDGEIYVVDIDGSTGQGRVRRIEPAGAPVPDTIPDQLSNSGCVDPNDITQPYSGLLPYDLNAPFWSDGAEKDRYIGLPNGATIDINADGDFEFPEGSVIVKNFRLGGALVETRHLMRHPDGVWAGYTYEWNSTQTEATRVRGGKVVTINNQDWIYPSESGCMACHTAAAGRALGPENAQLNKTFNYVETGRTANQLETIEHVMMFSSNLPGPVANLDALADPTDTSASLDDRARAYLHSNCAGCHRPNGPTPSTLDLRYGTALADTNACDATPLQGDLGIAGARLIAPGNAAASLVVDRMQRRDIHGMPPLGSNVIDTAGVNVVSSWIDGLSGCN